ncbi:MAG: SAF domain-containing protein [Anaerolineales bacterium]
MLRRLASSGVNLAVLIVAVIVFIAAFIALSGLAAAQRPPTVTVLAAARNIPLGAVITSADLVEKTVYEDDSAALYIPVDQAGELVGGVAALPIRAGQPVSRDTVIAPAGEGHRLSAALGEFPDHSLFPLPLEASNVIAPEAASFLTGDLVGITVVIGGRPQPPATPTPDVFSLAPAPIITTTTQIPLLEIEAEKAEALDRAYPPLAKDLFPQGVLVMAVQGLPQPPAIAGEDGEANDQPIFAGMPEEELLVLLVPNESREQLALAMQRADQVFVFLLGRGEGEGVTPGFTYWDFEDLFKADRDAYLDDTAAETTLRP